MKRIVLAGIIIGVMWLGIVDAHSQGITIAVHPIVQEVAVGDTLDVALTVTGLTANGPMSLSAFDIDLLYDPSGLSLDGEPVFGDQLDVMGWGAINGYASDGAGTVSVWEVSMDLVDDLHTFQEGEFTLATLSFDAISAGMFDIGLNVNSLGVEGGVPSEPHVLGGSVLVVAPPVPEPGTLLMLGPVLLCLTVWRCRGIGRPGRA